MEQISNAGGEGGITAMRSSGTTLWIDTDSAETSMKLVAHLRANGIIVQPNGTNGVIARPSLLFGQTQAQEL